MNIRIIAASFVACTLALGSTATAVASPKPDAKPSVAAPADDHRLVEVPEDHSHLDGTNVSMRAMYKRAGLGVPPSQRTATKTAAPAQREQELAATATTSGSGDDVLLYGMRDHVDNLCVGTGTDGARVELLYVREADQPDRYADAAPLIRREARLMDDTMALSAKKTNGGRRIRYLTDGTCQIVVKNVVLPDGAISNTTGVTRNHLMQAGYNLPERRYLAFADVPMGNMTGGACGSALNYNDSTKVNNPNNSTEPQYARVDLECWSATKHGGSIALHELMHTFGAVFTDAPNTNEHGHCVDDSDLMCYAAGWPGAPEMRQDCPVADEVLLDCGNDDYFHTNPPAGSYLATHWNIADSRFLATAPAMANPPTLLMGINGTTDTKDIGQDFTFNATVQPGSTVTWTYDVPQCQVPTGSTTGSTFTLRCWQQAAPTVTATASNPNSLFTTSDSTQVFYNYVPSNLSLTRPTSAQFDTPYQVSATVTGPGTWTYQWELVNSPGCTLATPTAPQATVTCNSTMLGQSAGAKVTVVRTEDGARLATTGFTTIVDSRNPVVTINGPTALAPGQSGTFTSTVSNATNPTYTWTSGSGWATSSRSGTTFTVQPPSTLQSGMDAVSLTVRSDNGRSTTVQTTYTVETPLTAGIAGPTAAVSGNTVAYEVMPNKAANVTWVDDTDECDLVVDSQNSLISRLTCLSDFEGTVVVRATVRTATGEQVVKTRTVTVAPYRVNANLTIKNNTANPDRLVVSLTEKPSGKALAGYRVVLERRGDETNYAMLRTGTTNADGKVVFSVEGSELFFYRAVVTSQNPVPDMTSAERMVFANGTLAHKKVRGGLRAIMKDFHGKPVADASLVLQQKPKGARSFKNVRLYITNAKGMVTVKKNPKKRTQYRWLYRTNGYYRPEASKTITLR